MSWQATHWVITHSKQKGSALLTLLCIANCANEDGSDCWPNLERLARDTRLSRRQLIRIVDQLERSGELNIHRSAGRYPNHYSLPLMNSDKMSLFNSPTVTSTAPNSDITVSPLNSDILSTNSDIAMSPDPSIERSEEERSVDPPYASQPFLTALNAFKAERRRMKKPLSPLAERLLYRKLAGWPEAEAIAALEDSVIHGYQGVFPVKENGRRYVDDRGRDDGREYVPPAHVPELTLEELASIGIHQGNH